MEEMQITSALTWIEVQFTKKAVDDVKVDVCYGLLSCQGDETCLFPDNQRSVLFLFILLEFFFYYCFFFFFFSSYRDLEKTVEDLSELLESPIEAKNIPTLRQQVTNKTVCLFLCLASLSS